NISKIKPEVRKNITILFQETKDKKVVNWCREKGFKEVIELSRNVYYRLGDDFELMNSPYLYDDSWLFIKTSEKTILNINDCVVSTEEQAISIKNIINTRVDVLFTQFSYASYYGNKEDVASRKLAAQEKIEENKVQIKVFDPAIVVPFASYVWHSHEENYYMNDEVNKIDKVFDFLKTTSAKPIVLYPGEVLDFNTEHDSQNSVNRYMADYDRVLSMQPVLRKATKIPVEELTATANEMSSKVIGKYGKLYFKTKLRTLQPLVVYLPDHDLTVSFSFLDGLHVLKSKTPFDISMSSEVLNFGLKFDFGFGSTFVNGRLQTGSEAGFDKFKAYNSITVSLNNDSFKAPDYYKLAINKVLRILKIR
ncbi:MAG: hypothetical protein JWM28_96, partial [Chitinophagaceae bacterium]|nr:hypothetical protein [Chitinophagaceae bacterium]